MAEIVAEVNENNEKVFNVALNDDENSLTLATADTYLDKNIVFNISSTSRNVEDLEQDENNCLIFDCGTSLINI